MKMFARRSFLVGGMAFTLGGCGENDMANMARVLINSVTPFEEKSINRATIEDLPYASMIAKIGNGPQSLVILSNVSFRDFYWYSADLDLLVTRNGRLIRTAGLPRNLSNTIFFETDFLVDRKQITNQDNLTYRRQIDLDIDEMYGVMIFAKTKMVGIETITIAERSYQTIHLKEICRSDQVDWSFENHFWRDVDTGFVWRSIQYYVPSSPPLLMEIAKPYAYPA